MIEVGEHRSDHMGFFKLGFICLILIFLCGPVQAQESQAQESKLDQAIEQIARANYLEASDTLTSYLDAHPENAEAWYLLGRCRNRLEIYEEAYAALANARAYGARTPDLNREIGFALQGLDRTAAALQYLRKAEEDDPEAWLARGQIQLKRKKYKQAKQAIDRVLELGTTLDASAHFLRARILVLEGKPRLARDQLEKGLQTAQQSTMESSYIKFVKLLQLLDKHVFRLYIGIFYGEEVNEERGVIKRKRLDAKHRERIASAFTSFQEDTAEPDRSPARFRQYVRDSDEHAQTNSLFENLKKLFNQSDKLDLSDEKASNLRLMIVRSITPEGMTTEFLVRAIRAEDGK